MQEVEYDGVVHNLQVDGDESYVVEDVAVHNCWICDQAIRFGGFKFSFGNEEYEGSIDDFIGELTGEDALVEAADGEQAAPSAPSKKPPAAPVQLEGEDLLRELVKRQFKGRHPVALVPDKGSGKRGEDSPGVGDLVDERDFW